MSNKVDKFIAALFKAQGDELLFTSTRPVRIRVGEDERVVLDQEVRTEQIDNLIRPCLSPEDGARYSANGEGTYGYASEAGRVRIHARRKNAMVMVSISPDTSAAAAAPGPADDDGMLPGFDSGRHVEPAKRSDPPVARAVPIQAQRAPEPAEPAYAGGGQGGHGGGGGGHGGGGHGGGGHGGGGHGGGGHGGGGHGGSGGSARVVEDDGPLAKAGASDLHLTAKLAPLMRKDGDIMAVPGYGAILTSDTLRQWLMEIAPVASREKFAATHDADYAYELEGVARFRVNVFRDRRGVGGVLRVIPSKILTADQLKLPPVVRDLCNLEKGLVVVTGPTGSGKSTTLAAMIDLINKSRSDHVITIEDPVEFVHEPQRCLINQREIHSHTESFSAALRAALREDPDIVLVGEMRDLETVSIAIETAETGHLVFGTLHTNTAVSTVDRVIDQFPTDRQAQVRVMLSESLKGVVAQTLCKKIGGGRVAALEILVGVPAVANMIREGKTFQITSIMQTGKKEGMMTQIDWMMDLVKTGKITPTEAYTKAADQGLMKGALERAGHKLDVK
jgi:twitching motility protein PilT